MNKHNHRSTGRRGLDFDSLPMKLWKKSKKLGIWDPEDIDLAQDKKDWHKLSPLDQEAALHLTTLFLGGEEAVTLDLLPLVRSNEKPNLLLMRTFSKIYGLAGLRIGYGIGHPDFVSALEKVRQPFNTNAVAQAGAMAALDDDAHLAATRSTNADGLKFFEALCVEQGIEFVPSYANFVMLRVGDGQAVFEAMQRQGVITRPMGGYGLPE